MTAQVAERLLFVSVRSSAGHAPTLMQPRAHILEETAMTLGTILLVVLVLLLLGAIPQWPHSRNWGYGPSGALGVVLVVVVALLLMGRL
jgi:hypothetical protein